MTRLEQLMKIKYSLFNQALESDFLIAKQCFYNASKEIDKIISHLTIEQLEEIVQR